MSVLERHKSFNVVNVEDEGRRIGGVGARSNRTLLDIIGDESGTAYKDLVAHANKKNKSKSFKDRLGLRRSSSSADSSYPHSNIPTSDITPKCRRSYTSTGPFPTPPSPPADAPHPLRTSLAPNDLHPMSSPPADAPLHTEDNNDPIEGQNDIDSKFQEEERGNNGADQEPPAATVPVMSLMDLLGDTGMDEEEEEEEEEGEEEVDEGGVEHVCCVCMVRHKGAAFIPCGHTFCRLCSRELWVSRGNCPLCNGFILEILDIF